MKSKLLKIILGLTLIAAGFGLTACGGESHAPEHGKAKAPASHDAAPAEHGEHAAPAPEHGQTHAEAPAEAHDETHEGHAEHGEGDHEGHGH